MTDQELIKYRILPNFPTQEPSLALFKNIVTYIDSPYFIETVKTIREKWKIKIKTLDKKSQLNIGAWYERVRIKIYGYEDEQTTRTSSDSLQLDIEEIKLKMGRHEPFPGLVEQAIFFGAVIYIDDAVIKKDARIKNKIPKDVEYIIVLPETTLLEVKKQFTEIKDRYDLKFKNENESRPKIAKFRNWYWLRLSGFKFSEIAKKNDDTDISNYLDVIKGVKSYESLLVT